ncbi:MAG: adenine phosphoribosyltransferase [Candidatus Sericytochromatia bacterium]
MSENIFVEKTIEKIKSTIRDVPDFPKEGILFKDITPVLKDAEVFKDTIKALAETLKDLKPDYIAGIESRGFILGAPLAYELGVGFTLIRKKGKLPYKKKSVTYSLEYGTDTLEIHEDAVEKGKKVIIIDDLLATGGTALASYNLLKDIGADVLAVLFLVELGFLKGRERLSACKVMSLINYS